MRKQLIIFLLVLFSSTLIFAQASDSNTLKFSDFYKNDVKPTWRDRNIENKIKKAFNKFKINETFTMTCTYEELPVFLDYMFNIINGGIFGKYASNDYEFILSENGGFKISDGLRDPKRFAYINLENDFLYHLVYRLVYQTDRSRWPDGNEIKSPPRIFNFPYHENCKFNEIFKICYYNGLTAKFCGLSDFSEDMFIKDFSQNINLEIQCTECKVIYFDGKKKKNATFYKIISASNAYTEEELIQKVQIAEQEKNKKNAIFEQSIKEEIAKKEEQERQKRLIAQQNQEKINKEKEIERGKNFWKKYAKFEYDDQNRLWLKFINGNIMEEIPGYLTFPGYVDGERIYGAWIYIHDIKELKSISFEEGLTEICVYVPVKNIQFPQSAQIIENGSKSNTNLSNLKNLKILRNYYTYETIVIPASVEIIGGPISMPLGKAFRAKKLELNKNLKYIDATYIEVEDLIIPNELKTLRFHPDTEIEIVGDDSIKQLKTLKRLKELGYDK